jgi:hypothetical protein
VGRRIFNVQRESRACHPKSTSKWYAECGESQTGYAQPDSDRVLENRLPPLRWHGGHKHNILAVGGDSISAIRYAPSLRSKGVARCTVSWLYESPMLSLPQGVLKSLQIPHSRLYTDDTKTSSNDVYSILEFHNYCRDIIDRTELEAEALGVSQSVIKWVYPATSMQRAMLLQTGSHSELYITQVILGLQGKLDTECMTSTWRAVCCANCAQDLCVHSVERCIIFLLH